MVGADSRHWGSQNSQPLGRTEIPVPKPNLPFPHSNSTLVGVVDVQHAANLNAACHGLSNNDMFSVSHATQHTRENINQSSDTGNPNSVYTLLSKDALQNLLRSIEDMNRPQLSGQPQAPSMSQEQLRRTLLPVLLKNVQRRPDFNDNLLTKVEVGLRESLTDQFCDSLTRNLQTIKQEIQATRGSKEDVHATATVFDRFLSLATVTGPDEQNTNTFVPITSRSAGELPSAPRAMRSESSTRLTSQGTMDSSASLPKSRRRDTYDFGRLRTSEQEPSGSALSARERRFSWDHPLQKHGSNGIPVPLDDSFIAQPTSTIRVKRESPGPSTGESSSISRLNRSRSPHRRSLSVSSRHSRHDTIHRRFSHHESSNLHHSRSPPPHHRDLRRSPSNSQSRKVHSPPPSVRRHRFSRTHSRPPGSGRSSSRPRRKSSFSRRQQSPPAHVGRSRSPRAWKPALHDRDGSFRRRSPEHASRRKTPVHMRSIDRTRPWPSPHRRDSISDRPGLIRHDVSRSPEPLSTVDNLARRHPSPSPRKRSRSPDSASYLHRLLPFSRTRIRSRSPVRVSFRHRLSRTPDENHPGPLMAGTYTQGVPHINAPERSPIRHDLLSMSANRERPTPLTVPGMVTVKREPDVEDFMVNLHPSPSTNPSPVVIPSSDASISPRPGFVSPSNVPPVPPSQVAAETTHPPPARASPSPQSPIDINSTIQVPSQPPDLPEECRHQRPLSVERGANIQPSPVSCPPSALPEVLPIQSSSQRQSSAPLPLPSQPCQPFHPPPSPPMAAQSFPVPGLWFAKHGQDQADILDCEFEVNSEIMQKWLSDSSTPEAISERLSLQLLCIPVELLQSTFHIRSIHELVDLGALTGSVASIQTVWPEQGSLLVQMNPTKPNKRSWFPDDMSPTSPSLDITDSVHEGKNVLRLIQLEDMTNKIFMLQALLLPPTSQQDTPIYWDIADLNLAGHLAPYNLSPAIVEVI